MLKIYLQDFDGSCKGSAASGEWGRPIGTKAKGRPMLEKKARIADEAEIGRASCRERVLNLV